MNPPPAQLDGADVLGFVILRPEHQTLPANSTSLESVPQMLGPSAQSHPRLIIQHYLANGQALGPVPALALSVYLFYCSDDWEVVQDDVFHSLDAALEQATVQYPGLTRPDWQWYTPI